MRAAVTVVLFAMATPVIGAGRASAPADARFALRGTPIVEPAPSSSRFSMRARFTPEASVGELREGGGFVLLGRFAKRGVACGGVDAIFRNGFEAP